MAGLCWEVVEGKERPGLVVDLSWEGVRLERPFVGGVTPAEVQLELDVPGIDEVIWAKAGACFDEVVAAPVDSISGGPMGLVRRTGFRLLAAASQDLKMLREYLVERRRRARQLDPDLPWEPESRPAGGRTPSMAAMHPAAMRFGAA
ncbi:MAG: hypothetical protein R3B48_29165 [Kofleriaceae bacterium]